MTDPNKAEDTTATDGFTRWPNDLFGRFTPTQAVVYLAVRKHEGMRDGARPSVATLMALTGQAYSTVTKARRALEKEGVLKRERRGHSRPPFYTFPIETAQTFTMVENSLWALGLDPAEMMLWVALVSVENLEHGIRLTLGELASMTRLGRQTVHAEGSRTPQSDPDDSHRWVQRSEVLSVHPARSSYSDDQSQACDLR